MELTLTIAVSIFIIVSIYTIIGAYKRQHKAKEESKVPNFSDYAEDSKMKTIIDNYPFLDDIVYINGILYTPQYRIYTGVHANKNIYTVVRYPRFNTVRQYAYSDQDLLNIVKIKLYDSEKQYSRKCDFKREYYQNVRNPSPERIEEERIKNEEFLRRYKKFIK